MDTFEALQQRKSVRSYLDRPVEKEKLDAVLRCGNNAPCSGPLHLTVVRDTALLQQLNDAILINMKNSDSDFLRQRAALPGYQPLYGAPVLILASTLNDAYGAMNAACAVTTMCIAATDLGLGSCFVVGPQNTLRLDAALLSKMRLPAGHVPQSGLLLGYEGPAQIPPSSTRKKDGSNIHFIG